MLKNPSEINSKTVLNYLQNGHLMAIAPESKGGLILCKRYHAELVGPGAAVGGILDVDCTQVITIGTIFLNELRSYPESQQAYDTRQQWIHYLQDLVKFSDPLMRSQKILHLLDNFFHNEPGISRLPDDTLAMLAGVLPKTITLARNYHNVMDPYAADGKIQKKVSYENFGCNFLQSPKTLMN